ncbi:PhoU domain-containing protein [Candidatus Margulisiibacteriota bacterium]
MLKEFFQAFLENKSAIDDMKDNFSKMMKISESMFEKTSVLMFEGGNMQEVHEYIFPNDKELNKLEQAIRREVITHLALSGNKELSTMLIFMSVVKDAERIGDYIKNCFEIYEDGGIMKKSDWSKKLWEVRNSILPLFDKVNFVFNENKYKKTASLIKKVIPLERTCNEYARELIRQGDKTAESAKLVCTSRYFKRITSHLMNILTSLVMPLDKLDYFDEDAVANFKNNVEQLPEEEPLADISE